MQDYTLTKDTSPDSVFNAQQKPSTEAIKALKNWRDNETGWTAELLDAIIVKLQSEVIQR
ncbi:MAG: hypothetical protein ABEJ56_00100 [Candidatus Nanohaloarchaea archaeon]